MLRVLLSSLLLFSLCGSIYGQSAMRKIDSIKTVLKDYGKDTVRLDAYMALSMSYYRVNTDSVKHYALKSQALIQDLKKTLGTTDMLTTWDAQSNQILGAAYAETAEYDKSLEVLRKGLEIIEAVQDTSNMASFYNNIGFIIYLQGDIQGALQSYHKALRLEEGSKDLSAVAYSLSHLAGIYEDLEDTASAFAYNERCLKLSIELGNRSMEAVSYNALGMLTQELRDSLKAIDYFHQAYEIYIELEDRVGQARLLNNYGTFYTSYKEYTTGLEYFLESLEILRDVNYRKGISASLVNIADAYINTDQLDKAVGIGEEAYEMANETRILREMSSTASLMAKITRARNDFKASLAFYEEHIKYRDSLKNESNTKAMIRQQTTHEFEKAQLLEEQKIKENERNVREETQRRDNIQYTVILMVMLIVFGSVLGLGFIKVSPKVAEGLIFFSFLILFEFILVLADPYVEDWTNGAPGYKLLFNAGLAALIFPLHAFFESFLKSKLVK